MSRIFKMWVSAQWETVSARREAWTCVWGRCMDCVPENHFCMDVCLRYIHFAYNVRTQPLEKGFPNPWKNPWPLLQWSSCPQLCIVQEHFMYTYGKYFVLLLGVDWLHCPVPRVCRLECILYTFLPRVLIALQKDTPLSAVWDGVKKIMRRAVSGGFGFNSGSFGEGRTQRNWAGQAFFQIKFY